MLKVFQVSPCSIDHIDRTRLDIMFFGEAVIVILIEIVIVTG